MNVIEAAEEVGQPHIVRHSMWGPEESRIVQQGMQVEEELKESELSWTILRPTFFMQNILGQAQNITAEGKMYWSLEDADIAMIDIRDIADSAVRVLTEDGHQGETYRLTGPEAISFNRVAEVLSDELNREIQYVSVPDEAAKDSMIQMGMDEWVAKGTLELFEGFRQGFANEASEDVTKLKGESARSIGQFTRDFAGMLEAQPA